VADISDKLADLAMSASVMLVGKILGRALGLLGLALIIRSMEPGVFGHVALAYAVARATGQMARCGLPNGVTRLFSATADGGDDDEAPDVNITDRTAPSDIVRAGILLTFCTGLIGALAVYGFSRQIAGLMSDPELVWLLPVLSLVVILRAFWGSLDGTLRATGESFKTVLARDILPKVGALVVFFVASMELSPVWAAMLYWIAIPAVGTVITAAFVYPIVVDFDGVSDAIDASVVRKLWSYSWPLAMGSVVFLLLANLDVLMLGYLSDSVNVGLYRSVQPLQQISIFVMSSFTFLFLPIATRLFENDQLEELQSLYTVSTKWITAATLPLVLVFGLFPAEVIAALLKPSYTPAAPALTLLVFGIFGRALVGLNGDVVQAMNRPKIELYAAVPGFLANGLLNFLLIPRYGIVGAAFATVVGYAVYNAIELGEIYRSTGIHPFSGRLFRQLVPTAAFGLACRWLIEPTGLPLLIAIGGCFVVVQLLSMVFTRSLDSADIELLRQVESSTGLELAPVRTFLNQYVV